MNVLLTGITGLVGSHVAISLLERDHRVMALARSRHDRSAEERVTRILGAYPGYDPEIHSSSHLRVMEGDVGLPSCKLQEPDVDTLKDQVDAMVHCAGVVSFSPRSKKKLDANILGVRHVLDLAQQTGCTRLIHVSTAYIDQALNGDGFRNEYERTKFEAEKILQEEADHAGVGVTIVRPSIVTGDRQYGFTPTCNGIHTFFRFAITYGEDMKRIPPADWLPDNLVKRGQANLVPADHVAAIICGVIENGNGQGKIFNVTNPAGWPLLDLANITSRFIGGPPDDSSPDVSDGVTKMLGILSEQYRPYFTANPVLDTAETDLLMREAGISPIENSTNWIQKLLDWNQKQAQREGPERGTQAPKSPDGR